MQIGRQTRKDKGQSEIAYTIGNTRHCRSCITFLHPMLHATVCCPIHVLETSQAQPQCTFAEFDAIVRLLRCFPGRLDFSSSPPHPPPDLPPRFLSWITILYKVPSKLSSRGSRSVQHTTARASDIPKGESAAGTDYVNEIESEEKKNAPSSPRSPVAVGQTGDGGKLSAKDSVTMEEGKGKRD